MLYLQFVNITYYVILTYPFLLCRHHLKSLQGLCMHTGPVTTQLATRTKLIRFEQPKNQTQHILWEVLSDRKLTHLEVELSVFLPLDKDSKMKSLFQKCISLYALILQQFIVEILTNHSLFLQINFPFLTNYIMHFNHRSTTFVQDIMNSYKILWYQYKSCYN